MRKVDFFIAGAPKSGTTALYAYLSTHPDIFLPEHKEPSFFAEDYPNLGGRLKTLAVYEKLYQNHDKKIAGDCSVCYLGSNTAPGAIYRYNPKAKIILLLRHPVNLFISEHSQLRYSFYEDIENPFEAWQLQEKRRNGQCIPGICREPATLQYKKVCTHGKNLKKYLALFPRDAVLVLFFDDFVNAPDAAYQTALKFLGVQHDGRTDFPKVNVAKQHKRGWLARWLISPPGIFGTVHAKARQVIATSDSRLIKSIEKTARTLAQGNSTPKASAALSGTQYNIILSELLDDIDLLSDLTGRDLSHWKKRD